MLNSILANLVAGLGLFFSGLRLVDSNLRQATGRQLRSLISRITRRPWLAAFVGLGTGALVQSSSGIVFMLVSLVSGGLTTVRRALPIVTWANVGCCALVFATVLDLRLAILYLIGLAGAAFAFDRSHRNETLGALFGIGMLFYGIELMKTATEPLQQAAWFPQLMNGTHRSYVVAFLGGTAFSFVTQSSTAVSILAIGMARAGLAGPFATMMAIYGANVGSTFARMLLSSALKGSARQLTAYQDLFKIAGGCIFVPLLYLEALEGVPLVHWLVSQVSDRIDRQMAMVFLFFNLAMAVLFTALQPALARLLEWRLPADAHEDQATPAFLYDEALAEPATALDLIESEQIRLARRLRPYVEAMRTPPGSVQRQEAERVHEPFALLGGRIEHFQHDLVNQRLGRRETERLTKLQTRLSLIMYLEDALRSLCTATGSAPIDGRLAARVSSFIEALDFVLLTLDDALDSRDADTRDVLLRVTEDRSEFVERVRHEFLSDEGHVEATDRAVLLQVTSLFERVVWMVQRLARLIDGPPRLDAAGVPTSSAPASSPSFAPPERMTIAAGSNPDAAVHVGSGAEADVS